MEFNCFIVYFLGIIFHKHQKKVFRFCNFCLCYHCLVSILLLWIIYHSHVHTIAIISFCVLYPFCILFSLLCCLLCFILSLCATGLSILLTCFLIDHYCFLGGGRAIYNLSISSIFYTWECSIRWEGREIFF